MGDGTVAQLVRRKGPTTVVTQRLRVQASLTTLQLLWSFEKRRAEPNFRTIGRQTHIGLKISYGKWESILQYHNILL